MDSDLGGPGMDQLPAPLLPQQLTASQQQLVESSSVGNRQIQIEKQYESVLNLARERAHRLTESCRAFQLVREANELTNWIKTKEQHAMMQPVGDDLEQVEMMQKKFDDFQAFDFALFYIVCFKDYN